MFKTYELGEAIAFVPKSPAGNVKVVLEIVGAIN
jgi:hypothetical protein